MPGSPVDLSTGMSISYATSSFTAELIGAGNSGVSRKSVDVSHMGTAAPGAAEYGNMKFIAGRLTDAGSLDVEMHYNPDTIPPIDLAAEVITVTFPLFPGDTTAAKLVFTGFFTSYDEAYPLDDKMVVSGAIKVSGSIAVTVAT